MLNDSPFPSCRFPSPAAGGRSGGPHQALGSDVAGRSPSWPRRETQSRKEMMQDCLPGSSRSLQRPAWDSLQMLALASRGPRPSFSGPSPWEGVGTKSSQMSGNGFCGAFQITEVYVCLRVSAIPSVPLQDEQRHADAHFTDKKMEARRGSETSQDHTALAGRSWSGI